MTTYSEFALTLQKWRKAGCPDDGTFNKLEAMRAELAAKMQAAAYAKNGVDPALFAPTAALIAKAHAAWRAGVKR
jgi:hypothetical protein